MYKLLINIEGKNYYPVRAIPLATAGYISPQGTVALLSQRDIYFSARSYRYIAHTGAVEELRSDVWLSVKVGTSAELPPGVLLAAGDLGHVWFGCFCDPEAVFQRHPGDPAPDEERLPRSEALMTPAEYKVLMEGMPKGSSSTKRSNARPLEGLKSAMAELQTIARSVGRELDLGDLPGVRKQMQEILIRIDPSLKRASATFNDHARDVGWKWSGGARKGEDAAELYDLLNEAISKRQ